MNKLSKIALVLGTAFIASQSFAADNLLVNPGFETNDAWTVDAKDNCAAIQADSNNTKSGKQSLKFWADKPVKFVATQKVQLSAGEYTLGGFLEGGDAGDDAVFELIAEVNGQTNTATSQVSGWKNWNEPKVDFKVDADTEATVIIKVQAKAGAWGAFDDMYLVKK